MPTDRVEHRAATVGEQTHLGHALSEVNQQRQLDHTHSSSKNPEGQKNFDRHSQQNGTIELSDPFKQAPTGAQQENTGRDLGASNSPPLFKLPPSDFKQPPSDAPPPGTYSTNQPRPTDAPASTSPGNSSRPSESPTTSPQSDSKTGLPPGKILTPSETLTDPNKGDVWDIRNNWGLRNESGRPVPPSKSGGIEAITGGKD
ncbi:MAG TPA: hypothetical protein V6C97_12270 [Oculatellaceae cyanobacterium]